MKLYCFDAAKYFPLLRHRPECSGEAGGDPGEASEGSDLYQNEDGENSDIISNDHGWPCGNMCLSPPAASTPEQTQTGDTETTEESNPEDPRSASTHACALSQRSHLEGAA